MKLNTILRAWRVPLYVAAGVALTLPLWAPPAWWATQNVLTTDAADDFAVINQGQLKNMVRGAVDEMNAKLPGGAGPVLNDLLTQWRAATASEDFAVVNVGQLKAMGKLVRGPLVALNIPVPAIGTTEAQDDDDFGLANVGQAKTIFSITILGDSDGDSINDGWELGWLGTLSRDLTLDTDGDGFSDAAEYAAGTDPSNWCSCPGQSSAMLAVYTPVVR